MINKLMQPTPEQEAIIQARFNPDIEYIVVNARPGSGKTATVKMTIQDIIQKERTSNILYLVYNKAMCEDSKKSFRQAGFLDRIDCFTIHGFAFRQMGLNVRENILNFLDYKTFEDHKVSKFQTYYLNVKKILDLYCKSPLNIKEYCQWLKENRSNDPDLEHITDNDIKTLDVIYCYLINSKKYLHDLYLKEYASNLKSLEKYDYIFLDEAQDSTHHALSIVKTAKCKKKYIVGDVNQSIYQWNSCIDAMSAILDTEKAKEFQLSNSFRFGEDIASQANKILKYMDNYRGNVVGVRQDIKECDLNEKMILFRTNSAMLFWCCQDGNVDLNTYIELSAIKNGSKTKCFEEIFNDFLSLLKLLIDESGAMSLKKQFEENFNISEKDISSKVLGMKKIASKERMSLNAFLYEQAKTNTRLDPEISRYYSFICQSGNQIIEKLLKLKQALITENPTKRYKLMTTHASKGLEADSVTIERDEWYDIDAQPTEEDYNLIYVALTRSKHHLEVKDEKILALLK